MSIPRGYKLVPVEPTAEMINTGQDQEFTVDVYAAMLDAAPTPPQPIYEEAKERELFEAFAVNRRGGYGNLPFFVFARKENGQYNDGTAELAWEGWLACVQSRAKSVEVGDE
ncbi:MAG: hypothetical protein [Caudoviricetes sp.]|nr:MAG: hypothetical protein [Caudoviricetes sp.]